MRQLVGLLLWDVVLSRDEVDGLMAGLLTSDAVPTGTTRLGDGLDEKGYLSAGGMCPSFGGIAAGGWRTR